MGRRGVEKVGSWGVKGEKQGDRVGGGE